MTGLSLFGHRVAPVHSVGPLPFINFEAAGNGGSFFLGVAITSVPIRISPANSRFEWSLEIHDFGAIFGSKVLSRDLPHRSRTREFTAPAGNHKKSCGWPLVPRG